MDDFYLIEGYIDMLWDKYDEELELRDTPKGRSYLLGASEKHLNKKKRIVECIADDLGWSVRDTVAFIVSKDIRDISDMRSHNADFYFGTVKGEEETYG